MSAMPAEVAQRGGGTRPVAVPVLAQRRAERRASLKLARRSRHRWAVLSCSVLGGAFALTVGILDVLH
jgi:hypothetical protein